MAQYRDRRIKRCVDATSANFCVRSGSKCHYNCYCEKVGKCTYYKPDE